jgi:hypothetical protein
METDNQTSAKDGLDIARYAPILIGNRTSVIEALNREFPLQDPKTADQTKRYFYAVAPFEQQIDRIMQYNKTAGNKYVYAVIPYNEYIPEAELPEELKQIPEQYRTLRFIRAEIHR